MTRTTIDELLAAALKKAGVSEVLVPQKWMHPVLSISLLVCFLATAAR